MGKFSSQEIVSQYNLIKSF